MTAEARCLSSRMTLQSMRAEPWDCPHHRVTQLVEIFSLSRPSKQHLTCREKSLQGRSPYT